VKFTCTIEHDNKDEGCFMVVFRNPEDSNRIVGIPMRGVTKKEADAAKNPLIYAFEFGLKTMREEIERTIARVNPDVE